MSLDQSKYLFLFVGLSVSGYVRRGGGPSVYLIDWLTDLKTDEKTVIKHNDGLDVLIDHPLRFFLKSAFVFSVLFIS